MKSRNVNGRQLKPYSWQGHTVPLAIMTRSAGYQWVSEAHDFEVKKPEVKITTSLQQLRFRLCGALSLHFLYTFACSLKYFIIIIIIIIINKQTKLYGLSPQANYTDQATVACRGH
jgi:hypothetical protein